MNQKRLDEIRAMRWHPVYVYELIDEVERLLALVERREARSLKAARAGAQHIAELDAKIDLLLAGLLQVGVENTEQTDKQNAETELLLAALRQAERAAMRVTNGRVVSLEHGRFVMWECGHCAREFKVYVSGHKDRVGKHEADCPFAILEGGDTFAQE